MVDTPITKEEQYLAYLNCESDSIPNPVTRVEKYLYQLCMNNSGDLYSESNEDIQKSVTVKNTTIGVDVTEQTGMLFDVKSVKIGKLRILEVTGGKKIYNASTNNYQIACAIIIPTYFSSCIELYSTKGSGITKDITPVISTGMNQLSLTMSYEQTNSTSQYSPDSIYQFKKIFFLIEN